MKALWNLCKSDFLLQTTNYERDLLSSEINASIDSFRKNYDIKIFSRYFRMLLQICTLSEHSGKLFLRNIMAMVTKFDRRERLSRFFNHSKLSHYLRKRL